MRQISPDDYSSEFDENYKYYRQWIERGLVKQVYDRGCFDDLCQDTFVKALKSFARQDAMKLPQTDYALGKLLRRMAVQVAIDDSRKKENLKDYLYLPESEADTQIPEPMVEGEAERIIDEVLLQKVWPQLPPQQQVIARLMLQGFKQKDIAAELGVSPSTVNGYVKLAREELCKKIYPVTIDIQRADTLYAVKENECPIWHTFTTRELYQEFAGLLKKYREYKQQEVRGLMQFTTGRIEWALGERRTNIGASDLLLACGVDHNT